MDEKGREELRRGLDEWDRVFAEVKERIDASGISKGRRDYIVDVFTKADNKQWGDLMARYEITYDQVSDFFYEVRYNKMRPWYEKEAEK